MRRARASLLVLSVFLVAAEAWPQQVRDGPGSDQDYWTSLSLFQANWSPYSWQTSGTKIYEYFINRSTDNPPTSGFSGTIQAARVPTDPPPASLSAIVGFADNERYYTWIRAVEGGVPVSLWTRSDGFLVDSEVPVPSISVPAAPMSASTSLAVTWSAVDAYSGVDWYDVQAQADGGPWQPWLSMTKTTSGTYVGANGKTYFFRVRARDKAGNLSDWEVSAAATVNALGSSLSISASPPTLSFGAGQSQAALTLKLQPQGTGTLTLSSLQESRVYPSWGKEDGPKELLSGSVPGGLSQSLDRAVGLTALQRSKALGTSTSGSFSLTFLIQGTDPQGQPVQGAVTVPVAVSETPPSGLLLSGVKLELPASPYYKGDQVKARVKLSAVGAGTVQGQVLVDGSAGWSPNPAFTLPVNGDTQFDTLDGLPTGSPGLHTVQVKITSPVSLEDDTSYTVSDASPPLPAVLVLVPGVAELKDRAGTVLASQGQDAQGAYEEFLLNGTGTLRLPSLGGTELAQSTVKDLQVRVYGLSGAPQIRGGTVQKQASGAAVLVQAADGYLRLKSVRFQGLANPPADHLLAGAALFLPALGQELLSIENLKIDAQGVADGGYSKTVSQESVFTAFGLEFHVHDLFGGFNPEHKAVTVARESAKNRWAVGLAGAVRLKAKTGASTTSTELAQFPNTAFRFYTDGSASADVSFPAKPYVLIPGLLAFTQLAILPQGGGLAARLAGGLKNLPAPLDQAAELPVELLLTPQGNAAPGPPVLKELQAGGGGHGLGNDPSEWDLGLATVDLTYVSLALPVNQGVLDLDHGQLDLGVDLFLDLLNPDGSAPAAEGRRLSFGELDGAGSLKGGLVLGLDGKPVWPAPTHTEALAGKRLRVAPVELAFSQFQVLPEPFSLRLSGAVVVGLPGVSGEVPFANLQVKLNGDLGNLAKAVQDGGGGTLELLGAVQIAVEAVSWSNSASQLTFQGDFTTGSGGALAPQKGPKSVDIQKAVVFAGSSINLGASGVSLSGGFQSLTVYSASGPGGESTGLVVQGASLALADALTLKLDMEYNAAPLSLRFAGSLKLPVGGVEVEAAGKLTQDSGKPSVGLFAIAKNLPPIPVAPAVFMNEIGGGFFINPTAADITMVQSLAQFQKPEMNDELQDRLPGGQKSSSTSFALMVLGGFYVSAESLLSGRALLTLTGGYLDLQAEAQAAGGLADGRGSLTISWKPWYGEGSLSVAVGFPSSGAIVSGKGDASFYVYEGVWGVTGKVSLSLLGGSLGQTELFLGTPGFMVQAGLSRSIDLYIISGSLTLKGMFWYYAPKDNIGAYASIEADGDFLGGLFSASAGLEGALIVNPGVFLYAVGHVSAEALGVTLYSGSVWVSLGSGGLDGGKGRNHQYDQMIADAKGMAAALKQAKQALIASLQDAKLKLAELDAESRKVAGLALVEQQQSIFYGFPVDWIFAQAEVGNWGPAGLPPPIKTSYDRLFGAVAKNLVAQHKALTTKLGQINTELAELEELRQQVSARLAQYEDILLADLPAVAELGALGSPFQGWQEKTVQVGGQSTKVTSGFALDQAKAEKQADTLAGLREQFAAYQEAFIQQAGILDGRLRSLDEILFQGEDCLTRLSERFAGIHSELSFFTDGFVDFLGANAAHAGQSYTAVDPLEAQISQALTAKAQSMLKPSPQALKSWISTRADIIEELLNVGKTQGQAKTDYPVHPFEAGADLEGLFLKTGLELWYELPLAGWNQSLIKALVQVGQSVETFRASATVLWAGWGQSTALVEQVYSRKAELYDLLYEIYDQLSIYGSGQIGVAASGNAAGFAGWAAAGLSFRTGEMASAVKAQALPLPPGAQPPPKPTFGPNRPLQFLGAGPLSGGGPGAGYPLSPPQPRPLESRPLPGIAAGTFSLFTGLGSIQLKETGASLPSKGGYLNLDSSAAPKLPALPPMAWVPVTAYFQGKRAEIAPYLEVPQVTQLSATLASQSPLEALLEAQVAGSHPVAVVEYEYRIERALSSGSGPQVQGPYGGFFYQGPPKPPVQKPLGLGPPVQFLPVQATGQLAPLTAPSSPGQAQVDAVLKPTPWLSLGSLQQFSHLFLPELNQPGTFRLLVKLRGAGGKSIVRQGTFQVGYAQQTSKPFSSALDASDKSAPTVPVVGLQGAATSGKQILYAQWQSQDPESGIQSYAYAVEPYTGIEGQAAAQKAPGKKSGVTSTMEFLQSGAFSQLAADTPIVAGSGWVNAGGRTEANIRQLDLQQGQQYVVKVRATNGVGLSSVGSSASILVDATGPVAPQIQSFQQTQADGKANSVAFSIVPASDPESGISGHSFALGHSEKDEAVFPWTALQGTTATVVNLPLPEGEQVVLMVRALNGASTPAEASASLTLHYPDSSPPSKPSVLTQPANFSSDTGKIAISWSAAQDPDSGVLFYEYGLGSTPDLQDVLPWSPVPGASTAYLLGQAPQSTAAYSATAAAPLKDKQSYYAQVRSTNGVGLRSLASSLPFLIDLSPPLASLSAPAENKGRITLKLDLQASDAQSGVAEYRVLVWLPDGPLSSLPDGGLPGGAWVLPAAGWSMPGTLQGSFQLKGPTGTGGPALKLAPMPQGKPPWFASGWKKLSAGAPPQSLDVELLVSGFPDKGLQYGQSYTVAVEVRNGAGGVGVSSPVVVKVVPPPQGYQMTPKFSF